MRKNYTFIILLSILILGSFLRFYKLGNTSFVADEFLDINSSYAYAKTGEWKNWDFNLDKINEENAYAARDERAWAYKWQVAQLFRFFPPTEGTARTVSAIWGIISIILIYFVAKDFTKNKTIGLIAAFLFAISIDGIEFDRKLRMYAMFFPIFLAFSWSLFSFLEKTYAGKNKFLEKIWQRWEVNLVFFLPALILGILSLHLHLLTANIAITLVIYLIIMSLPACRQAGEKMKKRGNPELKKSIFNRYTILIGIGLAGLILGLIVAPSQLSVATKELGFTSHFSYIQRVFSDYQVPFLAAIFIGLGIYYLWKKDKMEKSALWLTISFLATLALAVFFWKRNSGSQYIFFVQSFKIILISCGIYFSAKFFMDNLATQRKKAYITTLLLALLLLPNFAYFFQENNTYIQTSSADNPNYRKIFGYFNKNKQEGDVLITRNFRNYYWSKADVKVFDTGESLGKEKMGLEDIKKIHQENRSGWLIISGNDETFITNEALNYATKNFEKISNSQVRGDVAVYRWGKEKVE